MKMNKRELTAAVQDLQAWRRSMEAQGIPRMPADTLAVGDRVLCSGLSRAGADCTGKLGTIEDGCAGGTYGVRVDGDQLRALAPDQLQRIAPEPAKPAPVAEPLLLRDIANAAERLGVTLAAALPVAEPAALTAPSERLREVAESVEVFSDETDEGGNPYGCDNRFCGCADAAGDVADQLAAVLLALANVPLMDDTRVGWASHNRGIEAAQEAALGAVRE